MKSHVLIGRSIIFAILLLSSMASPAFAQPQAAFALRDTTVQRGSVVRLDIRITLNNLPAKLDSMRLVVRYTPSLLLPETVRGGTTNLFLCPSPNFAIQFINLSLGRLVIPCNQVLASPRDTVVVCSIEFRVLASADSLATLSIDSLIINTTASEISPARRTAQIRVLGAPQVVGQFTDAIEPSYPNPANGDGITFPYTVSELSPIQFSIFSVRGEEVFQFPEVRRVQGRYLLRFVPPRYIPNGAYTIRMVTPRTVIRSPFMLLR